MKLEQCRLFPRAECGLRPEPGHLRERLATGPTAGLNSRNAEDCPDLGEATQSPQTLQFQQRGSDPPSCELWTAWLASNLLPLSPGAQAKQEGACAAPGASSAWPGLSRSRGRTAGLGRRCWQGARFSSLHLRKGCLQGCGRRATLGRQCEVPASTSDRGAAPADPEGWALLMGSGPQAALTSGGRVNACLRGMRPGSALPRVLPPTATSS